MISAIPRLGYLFISVRLEQLDMPKEDIKPCKYCLGLILMDLLLGAYIKL